jgi:hypothetical protein
VLKRHSPVFIISAIVAIVIGFGVITGIAFSLQSTKELGYEPSILKATKTGPNAATLNLSTFPDSQVCHGDMGEPQVKWVTYCSSTNLEVPPNSLITVVINQYDSATTLINDYFRHVHGTIDGTMTVNDKIMTEVALDAPGHTFTIQSPPDANFPLFVSVPLMGVSSTAKSIDTVIDGQTYSYPKPNVITFQFQTGSSGTYLWHCYDPCGDSVYARKPPFGFSGPMTTTGYMAGTLTVSSY